MNFIFARLWRLIETHLSTASGDYSANLNHFVELVIRRSRKEVLTNIDLRVQLSWSASLIGFICSDWRLCKANYFSLNARASKKSLRSLWKWSETRETIAAKNWSENSECAATLVNFFVALDWYLACAIQTIRYHRTSDWNVDSIIVRQRWVLLSFCNSLLIHFAGCVFFHSTSMEAVSWHNNLCVSVQQFGKFIVLLPSFEILSQAFNLLCASNQRSFLTIAFVFSSVGVHLLPLLLFLLCTLCACVIDSTNEYLSKK